MTMVIRGDDLVQSIADAFQFISYYHPADYVRHLARAYEIEESPAAKDAIAQILVNSRMAALGKRPLCQDTGTAVVFLKVGMGVRFETDRALEDLVNEGVRRAYTDTSNPLRASIVWDSLFNRANRPGRIPAASSALYARNLLTFLTTFWDKEAGAPKLPPEDEIVRGVMLTRGGQVVHPSLTQQAKAA